MKNGIGRRLQRWLRLGWRLLGFGAIVAGALADYGWRLGLMGGGKAVEARAQWLTRWSRRTLRLLHVRVQAEGSLPDSGMVACNHLGYLDIVVLASLRPFFFVSKADVKGWPVLGTLAQLAGTLFVSRERRTEVGRFNLELAERLRHGQPVVLFPEGTSSDGRQVLPFRSPLLAPVADGESPVTPAWLGYGLIDGSVADEVCYWRDMVFLPHFVNLLSKKEIQARVVFGKPLPGGTDRKQLAVELRERVAHLSRPAPSGAWPGTSPACFQVVTEPPRVCNALRS